MIIQCSQCNARYMVPDQSIGVGGRTVRCAKCQHSWFVATPGEKPLSDSEAPAPNAAKPLPPGSNLPVIKQPPVSVGVKASAFGLLAATVALFMLAAWPEVYGYPRSKGLALSEVNMLTRYDEKHPEKVHPTYEINGKIVNVTDKEMLVPVLRITLLNDKNEALQYWDFSEKGRTLEGKKNMPFSSGPLDIKFSQASRFVVELGSEMEISLRNNPE